MMYPIQNRKIAIIGIAVAVVALIGGIYAFMRPASGSWEASKGSIYPQFVRIDHKNQAPIVTRPFSADLDTAYVIDKNTSYDFIMKDQMREWAVSDLMIHMAAMENLEALAEETELQLAEATKTNNEKYITIETGDGYDAIRLLSETLRDRVAEQLGEEYIAAVPLRDFLIFWTPEFSLQNQFLTQIHTEYEQAGTYRLTPNPFRVSAQGIQQLEARPEEDAAQ